jgi:acetyltransferase-like isoleucine patch superfamily enzyme
VIRGPLKSVLNIVAQLLMLPAAVTCWVQESLLSESVAVYTFWAQVVAQLPGAPGMFLRRAFYRWTLDSCAEDVIIEFGAVLNRRAVLESGAFVGTYALIGWAWIRENTLIGSRASVPSGGHQHVFLPSGLWTPTEPARLTRVTIGPNTWVGEGAIVMANVGGGCMVAAGSVVGSAVPDGIMVAGNPARFVRPVTADPGQRADAATVSAVR